MPLLKNLPLARHGGEVVVPLISMQTRGRGGGYRTKESQRRRRRIVKLISSSSGSNGKRRIVKCLGRNVFESRDDDDDDVPTTSINTGHYTRLLQLSLIPPFDFSRMEPANQPTTRDQILAAMLPSTFFFFFFPSICSREFTSDVFSLLKGTLVNLITGQAFVRRNGRLCIPFSLRI